MKYVPLSFDVNLKPDGCLVDTDSLFAALAELQDRRDARGLRYALVTVLVFLLLAKLCGEDRLRGIAQLATHHARKAARSKGQGCILTIVFLPVSHAICFLTELALSDIMR